MAQKRGDIREGGTRALKQKPTSKHVAYYKGGRALIATVNEYVLLKYTSS